MTVFAFWNLNNKPLDTLVADLALQHEVDVLMLAECSIAPAVLLEMLNRSGESNYHYAPGIGCKRIEIYSNFTGEFIRPTYETDRLTIRRLALPGIPEILIAVSHYPSKLHWSDTDQALGSVELASQIKTLEAEVGHSRTVLVGDLNMNPFEDGLVSANALHATMSRSIAKRRTRMVHARSYPFFYNPMWNLLGDVSMGPPGTFYYSSSQFKSFFWNMFDQVLIRPDLLDSFPSEELKIVHSFGTTSLLSPVGTPDVETGSDHLPILFTLNL